MTVHYDLRTTSPAGTAAGTATRRRRIRLATLVGIVTTAVVVAGAMIVTQGEARPSAERLAAGASGAAVESVAPTGYWNAYLNEWVELAATEPATPTGYWNAYLNEWVELAATEPATPTGYWNAYLNEWVELAAIEPAASTAGRAGS